MRLIDTLVRFDGSLWWVIDVRDQSVILSEASKERQAIQINANDSRLDISSLPLGYLNYKGPHYPLRHPRREQRQPVSPNSVSYFYPDARVFRNFHSEPNLIEAYGNMFRNDYPGIPDAAHLNMAISKTWAFAGTPDKQIKRVFHKQYFAGFFFPSERLFLFGKDELTGLREASLQNILSKQGADYVVKELT